MLDGIVASHPNRPVEHATPAAGLELVSGKLRAPIRSLGFDLVRLCAALDLLAARVKNQTLPPAVVEFLSPWLNNVSLLDHAAPTKSRSVLLLVGEHELKTPLESLAAVEPNVWPLRLALLHLPALRGFWQRALRHSRFRRLVRILPMAWFQTSEPLPAGAVLPGLGITSWKQLRDDADFIRFKSASSAPSIMVERISEKHGTKLLANYVMEAGRVELRSLSPVDAHG